MKGMVEALGFEVHFSILDDGQKGENILTFLCLRGTINLR